MKFAQVLTASALAVVVFGATAVVAQEDPIAARQALMKANGRNAGALARIVKGENPYDAATVKAAFDQWDDTASKLGALFPDSSKTGKTRALPAIWSEREKFEAAIANFKKDVDANRDKAMSGLDGLKVAVGTVGKDCNNCHQTFREPQ